MIEPPLVLDADFLSSFAWVGRLDILERLYGEGMILLDEVMNELDRVPHIAKSVQLLIGRGSTKPVSILADAPEALELAKLLDAGRYGSGEAACMAYLKCNDGTLGSNNLSDVKAFCIENEKRLLTTADVLHEAYETGLVGLQEADEIWSKMLSKKRKLPAASFSDYLSGLKRAR